MTEFPNALRLLLDRATSLGLPASSLAPDRSLVSIEAAWRAAAEAADIERQIPILDLLNSLPEALEDAGPVLVEVPADRQEALLTLLPGAGSGEVLGELRRAGITHGIDEALLETCVTALKRGLGCLLRVPVARGTPSVPGEDPAPEFLVPAFSLERFRKGEPWTGASLLGLRGVPAGTPLGQFQPGTPGTPGRDVTGRALPAPRPGSALSDRIALDAHGQMKAKTEGVLVKGPSGWDLLPLFLVHGDYRAESGPISFPGLVAIEGSCRGVAIEAEDLFVGSDLCGGQATLRGDVHVAGILSGEAGASLSPDGMVTARAIESARVDALGDVLVRRAIANSEVTTLGRVVVSEPGGEISGGLVAALRGVSAPTLGSDFGVPTAIAAGRDFLTPRRLSSLEARITLHQENLRKITALKKRMALAGVDVRNLPPDKQDIYLGVLKKENGSKQELAALDRQRERFRQACADLLEATVQVGEALHPPVQIQIGSALSRIQERLRSVVLAREGDTIVIEEVKLNAPSP